MTFKQKYVFWTCEVILDNRAKESERRWWEDESGHLAVLGIEHSDGRGPRRPTARRAITLRSQQLHLRRGGNRMEGGRQRCREILEARRHRVLHVNRTQSAVNERQQRNELNALKTVPTAHLLAAIDPMPRAELRT